MVEADQLLHDVQKVGGVGLHLQSKLLDAL